MPLFVLILVLFGGLVGGVLFFRHVWFAPLSWEIQAVLGLCALSFAVLPFLMLRRNGGTLSRFERAARNGLYAWYVGGVLCMTFTLVADIVCLAGTFGGLWTGKFCLEPGAYNIGLVALSLFVIIVALWNGLKVPGIKRVVITSPKIKKPVKIAVLTDMHLHRTVSVEKVIGTVARVNAAKPDIIVMTGDIIDDQPDAIADLIAPLQHLNAPKWFVTGNHEFYVGYIASIKALEGIDAQLLENNGVLVKNVFLGGIPDIVTAPHFGERADVTQTFVNAPASAFRVLLSHTPIDVGATPPFDLEIAGHTHGGQVFPFHLLARLGNKYLAGLYHAGTAWVYVSRGAGQWGPQMRFLAPSEITLIELTPAK